MGAPKGNQNAKGHGCGRPRTWTDEMIDKEADFLLEWAHGEQAIVLGTCYGIRGYSYEMSTRWSKTHPWFAEAKELAKTLVGARREVKALKGQIDASLVKASMATYDPEYRAFLKEMKRDQILEDISAEKAAKDISEYIKSRPQVKKSVGKSSK